MRIPETVKVGPVVYRVAYVPDLRDDDDRNREIFGHIDTGQKLITLNANNSPEQMVSTFFHECIHALDYSVFNLGLSENKVKRLGAGLAMLLLDNHLLRDDTPEAP